MLKTNRPDDPLESDTMLPEFRLPTDSLARGVAFIRRRISLILSTFLITLGVGLLYLIAAVPTFTAEAQLLVESKAAPGDAASVSTIVESQIAIIKSESIARAVVGKLGLAEDPEFVRKNGVLRSMIRSISRLLGWSKPETESGATRHAMESFGRKLSVKRVGLTYIVEISFDSVDPDRATQILNTVAETYSAAQLDSKYKSVLRDEKWVKDRISELSSQASAAQKALTNYRKSRSDTAGSAETVDAGTPASQFTARTQGELRELEAAAESTARTYDSFLRLLRYMEAQQQSSPVLEARLLGEASRPLRASSPKVAIVLGISTIGGALLGIALGMLRDLSDRSLRTSEEVWKALQIACIGVVPRIKSDGAVLGALFADSARRHERALSKPAARKIARTASPIWTITDAPLSRFTDSFIEIKLAIESMNRGGKRNQVIGITSTQADEGKSTVAAALALLMANSGARVILVDCNLRNQSLSAALAPTAESGLLDVMSGMASVRETAWIEPTTQLAFLPVGNKSRPIFAREVLANELLDKLLGTLRQDYEYVIVDLSAVEPFADARVAVNALDSFIFVIEASRTNADVAKRGLDVIRYENVAGIVLNKANCDGL